MATYYWVGGSGTWNNASNTNWSLSSGGAGGAGIPNNSDNVIFDANSGTAATVDVTATATCLACTVNKADIALSLSGSATFAGAFTFTQGIVNLNSFNLTTLTFLASNANARTLAFGTGRITVTGNNTIVFTAGNRTNLTLTGSANVYSTYAGATGTRTINLDAGGGTYATRINLFVTAGTDTVTTTGNYNGTLDFTGFAGTWALGTSVSFYRGGLILSSTMTINNGTNTLQTFNATADTHLINFAGKTIDCPVTFNGVGGTWRLVDNMTVGSTRTTTLTNGTLDLDGKTLTTGLFNSSNSNTRTISFGIGKIAVTGNNLVVFSIATSTGLTVLGSKNVEATYSGATGTRQIYGGATEAATINLKVTAGTDSVTWGGRYLDVDFTGFAGSLSLENRTIYGNVIFSTGMTAGGGGNTTFAATTGPKTITTNGRTLDFGLIFNGVGGSWQFEDNVTQGSTRTLTLTNGTLNGNGKNVTIGALALGSGTKTMTLGSGTWTCLGAWNANTNVSGLTVSASTGTISMTSASAKTFSGGGQTWPTLNQGGAGNLTIDQSNTFANITNTVQPATITFTTGTTQTLPVFGVSGTSGNQITLNSSSSGTLATLNGTGGIVNARYVNIKDIRAQGYTEWNALVDQGAVDQGNNPGWNFITLGVKKILRRVFGRQIIRPVIEEI